MAEPEEHIKALAKLIRRKKPKPGSAPSEEPTEKEPTEAGE